MLPAGHSVTSTAGTACQARAAVQLYWRHVQCFLVTPHRGTPNSSEGGGRGEGWRWQCCEVSAMTGYSRAVRIREVAWPASSLGARQEGTEAALTMTHKLHHAHASLPAHRNTHSWLHSWLVCAALGLGVIHPQHPAGRHFWLLGRCPPCVYACPAQSACLLPRLLPLPAAMYLCLPLPDCILPINGSVDFDLCYKAGSALMPDGAPRLRRRCRRPRQAD